MESILNGKDRPRIGMFLGMLEEGCQTRFWKYMADFAAEFDVNINFIVGKALASPYGYDKPHNIIYSLASLKNLDGLVILSGTLGNFITKEKLKEFCNSFLPLPMVCVLMAVNGIPCVICDDTAGIMEEFDHLIGYHGYRRIAYIRGPEGHEEADTRYRAYLEALRKYSVPFDPDLVVPGNYVYNKGYEAVKILIDDRKLKFDALAAANDEMAIGAFKSLQERGIKVPRDMALAGFDDIALARNLNPPLTTIRQPIYEQTRKSLEMVLSLIHGEKVPDVVRFPTKFIIRESCGCITNPFLRPERHIIMQNPGNIKKAVSIDKNTVLSNTGSSLNAMGITHHDLLPWLGELLDVLTNNLQGSDYLNEEFYHIVSTLPPSILSTIGDEWLWRSVLSSFYNEIMKFVRDDVIASRLEILFQKVLIHVEEMILRPDPLVSIYEKHAVWSLRDVTAVMTTTFELEELMNEIAKRLPQLGITEGFIALYTEEPKKNSELKWDLPAYSRIIFSIKNGKREIPDEDRAIFSTLDLLPGPVGEGRKASQLITMPLFVRDEQFGFIVFSAGTRLENIYETLRYQISNSLKGAFMFKKQRETEESRVAAMTADRIKSQFLANMSHEIRTPMNAIIGYTGLLLEDEEDPGKRDKMKVIIKAGNNLLEIINDILDYSKMEAGKIEFEKINFSMHDLITDIRNMFIVKANEKGLNFSADIDINFPEPVYGDERRINQIILNLVSNAFKFTKEGSITINCSYEKRNAMISVSDTGIGILPEKYPLIFSSFSQADATTTREYGGTGLGLAISKGLTEKMGGKIYFESTAGKGSKFTVELPLPESKNKTLKSGVKRWFLNTEDDRTVLPEEFSAGGEFRVLVVEDNEMNRQFIGILLDKIRVKYDFASNGSTALEYLKKSFNEGRLYQLMLLDMQMPVMDGLEVIRRIRGDSDLKSLYVIAVTAHAMKGDSSKYKKAGCNDYISKPINKNVFHKKIIECMNRFKGIDMHTAVETQGIPICLNINDKKKVGRIINELKSNSRIFDRERVLKTAEKISRLGSNPGLEDIKNKLSKAAGDFDDEAIAGIIELLERIEYE